MNNATNTLRTTRLHNPKITDTIATIIGIAMNGILSRRILTSV
jgi:hypothetical protein